MNSLKDYEEPERMLLLAKIHHALWYNDQMFRVVLSMMDTAEINLPEAVFYPQTQQNGE